MTVDFNNLPGVFRHGTAAQQLATMETLKIRAQVSITILESVALYSPNKEVSQTAAAILTTFSAYLKEALE